MHVAMLVDALHAVGHHQLAHIVEDQHVNKEEITEDCLTRPRPPVQGDQDRAVHSSTPTKTNGKVSKQKILKSLDHENNNESSNELKKSRKIEFKLPAIS